MDPSAYAIERIQIQRFKKICDLDLEPGAGANVIFGEYRSGKTSLCEFIRFALFGAEAVSFPKGVSEDASGTLLFRKGEGLFQIRRSLTDGVESLSFTDAISGKEVETSLTPGEYLTGLDRKAYDVIAYFRQARYETPVFRPGIAFLDQIASFRPETENIYRDYLSLKTKAQGYRNEEETGTLDKLYGKMASLQGELNAQPEREAQREKNEAVVAELNARLDENEKRCVLIKADMANYADDLKLSENKENAVHLRQEIQAKEKELRLLNFEVTSKVGKLDRERTQALKDAYNRYSLALTELGEARNNLAVAQETLSFHEGLFTGRNGAEHYEEEKKRIHREKEKRLWARVLGVVFVALGISLGVILHFFNFEPAICLATAGALALSGVALFCVSAMFSASIRRILQENGREDLADFQAYCEKLEAHAKTTLVYREAVDDAMEKCEAESRTVDGIRERIHRELQKMGYEADDGDLLASCDEVIAANESVFDLEDEIRLRQEEYRKRLSEDVGKDSLDLSPEFTALQKELAFLTKQNDTLSRKRDSVQEEIRELAEKNRDLETLRLAVAQLEEIIRREESTYQAVKMDLALADVNRSQFEAKMKEALAMGINRKLSFLLKEGEAFRFDENFELCYCDQNSILPVISLGGGQLAEMGLLAFRLGLAEMMNKNDLPMIFDDPFAFLGAEEVRQFYRILRESCGQFLLSTISTDVADLCRDTAKILTV